MGVAVANKKYADLISDVLPFLAADPSDPVTEKAIKRTVIEFCAGSWIWQVFMDPVSVRAAVNEYDLEPETGADVSAVVSAELDGTPLSAKAPTWLHREIPRWRTVTGTPKYFTQLNTETVLLAPLPQESSNRGLTLTIAQQPSQNADSFPAWIYNQFADALINGAVSRLMLMTGRPWADAGNGMARKSDFEADVANARNTAVSALGIAPVRSKSQH